MYTGEGQFCPYADCDKFVPLSGDRGWKFCPHCTQLFWYKSHDGDFEDYHCFYPEERIAEQPPKTEAVKAAIAKAKSQHIHDVLINGDFKNWGPEDV